MEKIKTIMSEVLEMTEAGFRNKAAQKEALGKLSQAYAIVLKEFKKPLYGDDRDIIWEVPFELHHATSKKIEALKKFGELQGLDRFESLTSELRDLREAVKLAPVVKQPTKNEKAAKVYQSAIDRVKQYEHMVEVADMFKGLPVSATPHSVYRDGKWFTRVFFYFNGKLTPLTTIMAVAETISAKAN